MTERQQFLCNNVEEYRQEIFDAEKYIWEHPETGYKEWQTQEYLVNIFEKFGYTLTIPDNIPGFFTDIDTGKEGPKICIMAEMDALDVANHPEAVNGVSHCCGHHAQCAAFIGIAAALKKPGALDGLCGSIRLMAVPAEELIQLEFRRGLMEKGIISYMGGKVEFMHRGYFDGVDISIMVHGSTAQNADFHCNYGNNGCMPKMIRYKGKAAHAGGAPNRGINAQYAAMLGLQACNDLRETFPDQDTIRFHPIMMGVNSSVNIIPDEMKIETYVRGNSLEAMKRENVKINRALAGGALAMGAGVEIWDRPGYTPEVHDRTLMKITEDCCVALAGSEKVKFNYTARSKGSSDFGDLTAVMPGIQFNAAGAGGIAHGTDYCVLDREKICVNSAKVQLLLADALLSEGAAAAKDIIANYEPQFASIKDYFDCINGFILEKDAVTYDENGNATIDFQNV